MMGKRLRNVCALNAARSNATVRPSALNTALITDIVGRISRVLYYALSPNCACVCAQTMRRRSLVMGKRLRSVCALNAARCNLTVRPNALTLAT